MNVSELIKQLSEFPDTCQVLMEGGEDLFVACQVEKYKGGYGKILIRDAFARGSFSGTLEDLKKLENANHGEPLYHGFGKRFNCSNCGTETKGDTYKRKVFLCDTCSH